MNKTFKLITPVYLQTQEGEYNVLNLREKYYLNQAEKLILNKGLCFVPSWKMNELLKESLKADLQNYHRKLKLLAYFENKTEKTQIPFKPKSTWKPPPEKNPHSNKKYHQKRPRGVKLLP